MGEWVEWRDREATCSRDGREHALRLFVGGVVWGGTVGWKDVKCSLEALWIHECNCTISTEPIDRN
jgi:hypothetical protein